jgi:hypothetical protein
MKVTTPFCRRINGSLICSARHEDWDALNTCLSHTLLDHTRNRDAISVIGRCTSPPYDPNHPQTIGLDRKYAAAIEACGWPIDP